MADLMDMRWLVRHMNNRAVDEVRIQHVFTPGLPEEIKTEKMRRRKFAKAEMHIPFYFILDILYIWASFLSVGVSLIYFLMFPTLLGWSPSIQSFTETEETRTEDQKPSYDMLEKNGYRVQAWCAYYLFISIILFVVSWTSFIGAGVIGKRGIYIISLVNHGLIILIEAFAVYNAFMYLPPTCDATLFRDRMTEFFRWYGILSPHAKNHGHEAMDKIHELQAAFACCGVDSYKDYEKIFATIGDPEYNISWYPPTVYVLESYSIKDLTYYTESGREVRRMPHSCCNPFWRQNVYCADDIFTMERQQIEPSLAGSRLNKRGCVAVVKEMCERLRHLLTHGMRAVLIFRAILWLIMLVVTGITLRAMSLVMTTLFSVTRGNVRFIYDYRKTRPEEDPYKKAIGDFRRGIEPSGWDEFAKNRIEGRKKAHLINEHFKVGDLTSHSDTEDKHYQGMIRKWKEEENGDIYFGIEPPPDMIEKEYLALRGQERVRRQTNNVFSRLAKIGVDDRRLEAERTDDESTESSHGHRFSRRRTHKRTEDLEALDVKKRRSQWQVGLHRIAKEKGRGIPDDASSLESSQGALRSRQKPRGLKLATVVQSISYSNESSQGTSKSKDKARARKWARVIQSVTSFKSKGGVKRKPKNVDKNPKEPKKVIQKRVSEASVVANEEKDFRKTPQILHHEHIPAEEKKPLPEVRRKDRPPVEQKAIPPEILRKVKLETQQRLESMQKETLESATNSTKSHANFPEPDEKAKPIRVKKLLKSKQMKSKSTIESRSKPPLVGAPSIEKPTIGDPRMKPTIGDPKMKPIIVDRDPRILPAVPRIKPRSRKSELEQKFEEKSEGSAPITKKKKESRKKSRRVIPRNSEASSELPSTKSAVEEDPPHSLPKHTKKKKRKSTKSISGEDRGDADPGTEPKKKKKKKKHRS